MLLNLNVRKLRLGIRIFLFVCYYIYAHTHSHLHLSDGENEQWCIADEQTPDDELQAAMDWACGNGADCSKIQMNQPCYYPNTTRDHASYAFNSYFQKYKNKGGSCYFKGAAVITELDPSKHLKKILFSITRDSLRKACCKQLKSYPFHAI